MMWCDVMWCKSLILKKISDLLNCSKPITQHLKCNFRVFVICHVVRTAETLMRATSQWFFETQYIIMITLRVLHWVWSIATCVYKQLWLLVITFFSIWDPKVSILVIHLSHTRECFSLKCFLICLDQKSCCQWKIRPGSTQQAQVPCISKSASLL